MRLIVFTEYKQCLDFELPVLDYPRAFRSFGQKDRGVGEWNCSVEIEW